MNNITLSHYTVKDVEAAPWRETWDNLQAFAERMAPKLEPMRIKLRLRHVILEQATQDNLMIGNMVTIESPELATPETPIENLLQLELDYSDCESCRTSEGTPFPCRTFVDFDGAVRQALPEEFFIEATLRVAFKSSDGGCSCSGCDGSCGDEHGHIH